MRWFIKSIVSLMIFGMSNDVLPQNIDWNFSPSVIAGGTKFQMDGDWGINDGMGFGFVLKPTRKESFEVGPFLMGSFGNVSGDQEGTLSLLINIKFTGDERGMLSDFGFGIGLDFWKAGYGLFDRLDKSKYFFLVSKEL